MTDAVDTRRVEESPEWATSLRTGKPSYPVNATACAGFYRMRWPGRNDPWCPVSIAEISSVDPETGELLCDVTWECVVKGEPVSAEQVWPYAGRFPIPRQEFDKMMQQPSNSTGITGAVSPVLPGVDPSPIRATVAPERMQSDDIAKLAEALAKAQGEIEGAVKGRANPHFKSTYADLASVWAACRAALSGNGIAVVQMPESTDGVTITLITTLTHSSGQWMRSKLTMKAQRGGPQDMVSLVTYMRRTALAAMVGVAPVDDDDDGEGASGRDTKTEAKNPRTDDGTARANEWANATAAQLDKAKTVGFVNDLMNDPKTVQAMRRLHDDYPAAYDIVERARERAADRLTKAAA